MRQNGHCRVLTFVRLNNRTKKEIKNIFVSMLYGQSKSVKNKIN